MPNTVFCRFCGLIRRQVRVCVSAVIGKDTGKPARLQQEFRLDEACTIRIKSPQSRAASGRGREKVNETKVIATQGFGTLQYNGEILGKNEDVRG